MQQHFTDWLLIVSLICFGLAGPGLAQPPKMIALQGQLTDAFSESLPDDDYLMTFSLYTQPAEGVALWSETQAVPVVDGIYHVALGANLFPENLFDGILYFEVAFNGEILRARQRLRSTPFAMKAARADGVTDGGVTTAMLADDAVNTTKIVNNSLTAADLAPNSVNASEISTGAVGTLEIANGSVNTQDLAEDYVNTSGDTMTGTLTLPANGLVVGTNQLVLTGGRVGMGTASPNEQLELTGNLRLSSSGIIRSGADTLIHSYGTANFFAGENAGNLTMTGYNTASGYQALNADTTSDNNTALGAYALQNHRQGNRNTASGSAALFSSVTGIHNAGFGNRAGYTNITGNGNTIIGCDADASDDDLINATALGGIVLS